KLLIAGEEEGLFGSNYPIRELISSKKLKLVSPVKDTITGKMTTTDYEVEGPIALLFSTTQPAISYENATRCFTLSLDESKEQTNKIHQAQQKQKTLEGVKNGFETREIKMLHKNSQRLLKKLVVINFFAEQLSFPNEWLESRREYEKYLSLIETIAFLRQYQREKKVFNHNGKEIEYIEVEKEDIREANKLMTEILGTSVNELSLPSRELLKMIKQMVDEKCKEQEISQKDFRFNRRDVREYTGWSDSQIKAHIKQLEDLQYLLVSKGDRGRMYRYELQYEGNGGKKYLFGLTDPDKLAQKSDRSGMVWQEKDDEKNENTDDGTSIKSESRVKTEKCIKEGVYHSV
ncbi:MAG: DNA primase, partial [Elusimicrobiota bacterium]